MSESLEAIKKLKVEELKKILLRRGQPVTGKKVDLVLHCQVLFERPKTPTYVAPKQENTPLLLVASSCCTNYADITYESLVAKVADCILATDLQNIGLVMKLINAPKSVSLTPGHQQTGQ